MENIKVRINKENKKQCIDYIVSKIDAFIDKGLTVLITQTKKKRSNKQNRFLWAVYSHIIQFYLETGALPDNIQVKSPTTDLLHYYFLARFGMTTSRTTTERLTEYIDNIQNLMKEQFTEYTPLDPMDLYFNERFINEYT